MRRFSDMINAPDAEADEGRAPGITGTRSEAAYRLQVGLTGLVAVVLVIGLANIIMDRAQETEASAVPEAAATVAVEETAAPQADPLAEAGVVPDLPEPSPTPTQEQAIVPEQGDAQPNQ